MPDEPPKRCWFQFGLLSLIAFVSVTGITLAGWRCLGLGGAQLACIGASQCWLGIYTMRAAVRKVGPARKKLFVLGAVFFLLAVMASLVFAYQFIAWYKTFGWGWWEWAGW